MDAKEEAFKKRMIELSRISYERNICTYSDFLDLNEQNLLNQIHKNKFYVPFVRNGGYELAQRQMICFIPDAVSYKKEFPFTPLKINIKGKKFADKLSHRDYLGSILGLGIQRNKVGDIMVYDTYALVFVHEKMAAFLCDELSLVKHSHVDCDYFNVDLDNYSPSFHIIQGSISSLRLDALMALFMKESRSKLIRHIESAKVFVNCKLVTSNGFQLKEGDIISVRGVGKFQFHKIITNTKKGKIFVEIRKYI